ncbi:hypothetical protein HNR19_003803 [Nocardioides thalensis]|uniref:RNA polymerase sigma-70 region 2 domain-containing protein n=1 Tax=Nocardioides thalensis TaxID=1914755 RepID=A0A853C5M1_9ACTN|nr:sigma factor [Nocardioides thalensis]NYJ03105.1 hypothetical protein [Nocardioides thalensis]
MDFSTYVAQRRTGLVRTAVLLGCPRVDAEDVVQAALLKCYRSWRKVSRADHPDAYVHRVLVNTLHDARRRRWNGELPTDALPEEGAALDEAWASGIAVRRALALMKTEQREVLVLRLAPDFADRVRHFAPGFSLPWNDEPERRDGWSGCSGLGFPSCAIDPVATIARYRGRVVPSVGPVHVPRGGGRRLRVSGRGRRAPYRAGARDLSRRMGGRALDRRERRDLRRPTDRRSNLTSQRH